MYNSSHGEDWIPNPNDYQHFMDGVITHDNEVHQMLRLRWNFAEGHLCGGRILWRRTVGRDWIRQARCRICLLLLK